MVTPEVVHMHGMHNTAVSSLHLAACNALKGFFTILLHVLHFYVDISFIILVPCMYTCSTKVILAPPNNKISNSNTNA